VNDFVTLGVIDQINSSIPSPNDAQRNILSDRADKTNDQATFFVSRNNDMNAETSREHVVKLDELK
jgi:hypothetical protein